MVWLKERRQENERFKTHVAEHLRYGLAEVALVVRVEPLLIAAYTAEIDCVAFLAFFDEVRPHPVYGQFYPEGLAREFIQRHRVTQGSRLLAVNTFATVADEGSYAPDLRPGPKERGIYGNFAPFIADFLALNLPVVEERKRAVEEWEWQRCEGMADAYWNHVVEGGIEPRDGRLTTCLHGSKQQWCPGHEPQLRSRPPSSPKP